ncbi:MAG: copper amine oxidase N-terminal domain-containing protein [Clostridiales bacterium]|jgi:hypothetical protein|nr:copper amine oxidase N-terminal domain-containing protein [Clostridiales bacterium]
MKKVHALTALLVAVTLSLGSLSVVFAEEVAADAAVPVAAAEEVVVEEPAKVYDDLAVAEKSFYNLRYAELGQYPVIAGYDDLNAKILKDVEDAYALATDKTFTDSANVLNINYTVVNSGQFAKIVVTYKYELTAIKMQNFDEVKTYYVDKELKAEITKSAYNTGITPVEEPAEPEAVEEPATVEEPTVEEVVIVPIRTYAEGLGYAIAWDAETNSVILTKGDARFTVTVGKNEYLVDGELTELEVAPANQNGTVYVPVSFFEKVLGAVYSVDTEGNIVIAEQE